jgi:hypothetical protein
MSPSYKGHRSREGTHRDESTRAKSNTKVKFKGFEGREGRIREI